jgi:hypothetical protein
MTREEHRDRVYAAKASNEVSWLQPEWATHGPPLR